MFPLDAVYSILFYRENVVSLIPLHLFYSYSQMSQLNIEFIYN